MMRTMRIFLLLALPLVGACTGAKGDMGPSAPNTTPIYYYNNSFDTGGVSEWHTYKTGGIGTIAPFLDNQTYISPGQSLGVSFTSTVNGDSIAYIVLLPNPALDTWIEFDWDMKGASAGGFEIFANWGGTQRNAIVGFDSVNLYLVQGTTQVNVANQPDINFWHHFTIKISGNSGKTSYWMDGLTLGSDYQTNRTGLGTQPSGFLVGISDEAGIDSVTHLDNLKCYHF